MKITAEDLDKIIRLTGTEDSSGLRMALANHLIDVYDRGHAEAREQEKEEQTMRKYTVTCFIRNSDKTVEFYSFTKKEVDGLLDTKAKHGLFVNHDVRGHITAVDTSEISHIYAIPTY